MEPKFLQELASFSFARYIWSHYIRVMNNNAQDRTQEICFIFDWNTTFREVGKFISDLFPNLPPVINESIRQSSSIIGREISRWRSNIQFIVHNFDLVSWTPFFTIDRVKSHCKLKKIDVTSETMCSCCISSIIEGYRSSQTVRDIKNINSLFGPFSDHAILYWHWYGRENRNLLSHLNKYNSCYYQDTHVANMFKLSMFIEYEIAVFHYWFKMSSQQRSQLRFWTVPLLLSESDNLEFIEVFELLPSDIFFFFWKLLNKREKHDLSKFYFLDFYRYLLFHKSGINLVTDVLKKWDPVVRSIDYFKLLRLAIDTNNPELFITLWKRKLALLSFEDIGHLMWNLLFHKDVNPTLCVMVIMDYDDEHKLQILNELDKRIDCVKCDFSERIRNFLAAASLDHLRVTGFPRNPRTRQERQRLRRRNRRHQRRLINL